MPRSKDKQSKITAAINDDADKDIKKAKNGVNLHSMINETSSSSSDDESSFTTSKDINADEANSVTSTLERNMLFLGYVSLSRPIPCLKCMSRYFISRKGGKK